MPSIFQLIEAREAPLRESYLSRYAAFAPVFEELFRLIAEETSE